MMQITRAEIIMVTLSPPSISLTVPPASLVPNQAVKRHAPDDHNQRPAVKPRYCYGSQIRLTDITTINRR